MRDYRKLQAWQDAHQLTLDIYVVTRNFPADERFGLTSQMRRSSSSVATNIAEGAGRDTRADYARFIGIAAASANECEYQLILSRDLDFIDDSTASRLLDRADMVRRKLVNLRASIMNESGRET